MIYNSQMATNAPDDPVPFRPRVNVYGARGHAIGGYDAKSGHPRRPSEEKIEEPAPCKVLVSGGVPLTAEGKKLKDEFAKLGPIRFPERGATK